jgi:hypothetical protein
MRLLLAIFWSIGCGGYETAQSKPITYYETPELQMYVQRFEAYSVLYGPSGPVAIYNLKVVFGAMKDEKSVGLCSLDLSGTSTVSIDKTYWDKANPVQKEVLMFHELGHCVLARDHREDLGEANAPISLMFHDIRPAYYYPYQKIEYLKELFSIRNDWKD